MKTYKLDERGNPLPEACREVAACINRAIEKYPEVELDMMEGMVYNHDHPCGTTHCFAGLFLIGYNEPEVTKGKTTAIAYDKGVLELRELLGFNQSVDDQDIKIWAKNNPSFWGNNWGDLMFGDIMAFDRAKKPSQIAEWWEAVADRIEAYNKEMDQQQEATL